MPFSGVSYAPLANNESKFDNSTSVLDDDFYDNHVGQTTSDSSSLDEDLVANTIAYSQPKNGLRILVPCCLNFKKKIRFAFNFVLRFAFGRWPVALVVLLAYLALTIGLISIALTGKYHEFKMDLSLDSFIVPNIPVSREFSAFNVAKTKDKANRYPPNMMSFFTDANCPSNNINSNLRAGTRGKRETYQYVNKQRSPKWTLDLVYVAKGLNNSAGMFTRERLQIVHEFEKKLMRHGGYEKHCLLTTLSMHDPSLKDYGYCTPPNSLTTFFFPSKWGVFDGQGNTMQPIESTLEFLQSRDYFFQFVDKNYDSKKKSSNILRAQFLFGSPVDGIKVGKEQNDEFKKYLRSYIAELEGFSSDEVSLLYGGGDLFDYLVERTLFSDLHLALISLLLIIILLFILTFSLWLTLMAVVSIVSSIALAYFFYHVVFAIKYMGILNGVSLFVIIGIGVDDIFVFINTFRQAVDNKDLGNRMYHTISVAGKATFFTSLTTAAAFGANALSPIPAIHDFGLFMSILVVSCWISVLFIMSASLSLWHAGMQHLEAMLCHKLLLLVGLRRNARLRLPDDIREFLSGTTNGDDNVPEYSAVMNDAQQSNPLELHSLITLDNQDDDDHNNNDDDDDDDELLVLDNTPDHVVAEEPVDSLVFRLQSLLYHFVATPVVYSRAVMLVMSLVIFALSVFFLTKLKVSTEQPKFFKPGSNLERWLELPEISFKPSKRMLHDLKSLMNPVSTKAPAVWRPSRKVTKPKGKPTSKRHPTTLPRKERTTNAPSTRKSSFKTMSTRRQTTTPNPTIVPQDTTQQEEDTTTQLPWSITTQYSTSTTEDPGNIQPYTKAKNGMGLNNATTSPTAYFPTENPCRATYCGPNGMCRVVNGSASCVCQPAYTGKFCTIYCPVRTMTGNCCIIPFKYQGHQQFGCLIDETNKLSWCSLTNDYDKDQIKGYCNTTVANQCEVRTLTPNKTCCVFPFIHKMVQYYYCTRQLPGYGDHLMCGIQRNPTDFYRCDIPRRPKLCSKAHPCKPAVREPDGTNALVYLVFGIKRIDQGSIDRRHVLKETEGTVIYDPQLPLDMSCVPGELVKALCTICIKLAKNTDLVTAADCFPREVRDTLVKMFPDPCRNLPKSTSNNKKMHSLVMIDHHAKLKWLAMAFESTTGKLSSYSSQEKDYRKWEKVVHDLLHDKSVPRSLTSGFQTSETWVKMFSGLVVVESAVYGIVVSLVLCLAAVIIFTGHALLFLILFMTIIGVLLMVIAIFYLSGWELGGVEAVSLSILVGTSVDYCFHLVEGYILAGEYVKPTLNAKKSRQWRTKAALSHIGMSIISSAITTVFAAIPLCFAQIQLFAKFGLIVTINTGVSLLYTMTVTMAMLSTFGPARFRASLRSSIIGAVVVAACVGLVALVLYLISTKQGICIPSPRGTPLFSC